MWLEVHGPIPDGMFVCHKCDVPSCVNPDHLWLGTNAENQADKVSKGRAARGDKMRLSKLNRAAAVDVRERVTALVTELAAKYGVQPQTIRAVISGRRWPEQPALPT